MSSPDFMASVFEDARTHRFFTDQPVPDDLLKTLYETMKFAPSASNTCPMRVLFVTSDDARAKLLEAVGDGNKLKVASAPAVGVIAHDMEFYKHLGTLAPHLDPESFAAQDEAKLKMQASNNTWLQGGYFILAARALGLDCGPMSGFNPAKVDELFFEGSSWRASFLLSLGYGSGENIRDRAPRLSFDEACRIV
jgi:3-hydroxypropanoate dehydrogenase